MNNQEFFANYGTEKWAVEENLCFLLQEYWEAIRNRTGLASVIPIQTPLNPVGFVKDFMKEETFVDVNYAEQSKMNTLEKNEFQGINIEDLLPPTNFIEGEFREIGEPETPETTKSANDINDFWPM